MRVRVRVRRVGSLAFPDDERPSAHLARVRVRARARV